MSLQWEGKPEDVLRVDRTDQPPPALLAIRVISPGGMVSTSQNTKHDPGEYGSRGARTFKGARKPHE